MVTKQSISLIGDHHETKHRLINGPVLCFTISRVILRFLLAAPTIWLEGEAHSILSKAARPGPKFAALEALMAELCRPSKDQELPSHGRESHLQLAMKTSRDGGFKSPKNVIKISSCPSLSYQIPSDSPELHVSVSSPAG